MRAIHQRFRPLRGETLVDLFRQKVPQVPKAPRLLQRDTGDGLLSLRLEPPPQALVFPGPYPRRFSFRQSAPAIEISTHRDRCEPPSQPAKVKRLLR